MANTRHVVVTTKHRGVFFGSLVDQSGEDYAILEDARGCVFWSRDVKGFLGLASTGPSDESRVGPKVPKLTLYGVTSVTDCTPEAVERWEAGPWST